MCNKILDSITMTVYMQLNIPVFAIKTKDKRQNSNQAISMTNIPKLLHCLNSAMCIFRLLLGKAVCSYIYMDTLWISLIRIKMLAVNMPDDSDPIQPIWKEVKFQMGFTLILIPNGTNVYVIHIHTCSVCVILVWVNMSLLHITKVLLQKYCRRTQHKSILKYQKEKK